MKVLRKALVDFEPQLKTWSVERIADTLTQLGFESEVIDQEVLECTFTPNRGDAMSALGLARELRAWTYRNRSTGGAALRFQNTALYDALPKAHSFSVHVTQQERVPTYEAVIFEGLTVGESPRWLANAVTALGWRPINAIVDLTNYLMDLYGQPLHAFDFDAILGDTMTLRSAKANESITTLDGVERLLAAGVLVAEDRESIIDLPGVMGAQNSEISPKTNRILLQAAVFDRDAIRETTNRLGLRTQAAIRYERGVDPEIARSVLNEAIRMLKKSEFGGGAAISSVSASQSLPDQPGVKLDLEKSNNLLGTAVDSETAIQSLERIGCQVTPNKVTLTVTPPRWRYDLAIWQDLTEEIGRFVGLNDALPSNPLPPLADQEQPRSLLEWSEGLKDRLVDIGMIEVLTYSFVSRRALDAFTLPIVGELTNAVNPELTFLRPSLIPNLADIAARNPSVDPIQIFEIGHVFTRTDEEVRLGIALVGSQNQLEEWLVRFADAIGLDSGIVRAAATIHAADQSTKDQLKIRKAHAAFIEWKLSDLQSARRIPRAYQVPTESVRYQSVSKFPAVTRDLSIILPAVVPADEVASVIRTATESIESVQLFDEFMSDKFGIGKKSLAFHIRYSDQSRTLTDAEVDTLHDMVVTLVEQSFQAIRR